jgi:hypothetical protein
MISCSWSGVCVFWQFCIHIFSMGQSSLDCKANVEQFNHQCFERSVKIYEPLDIEVKKPRICGRHIMRDNVEAACLEDNNCTFSRLCAK